MSKFLYIAFYLFLALTPADSAVAAVSALPGGKPITLTEIDEIFSIIAQFLITVGLIFAVIAIVLSGIVWMYPSEGAVKIAKQRLKSALIGSLIVLGVGVIINTIASIVTRDFFCQFGIGSFCLIP